MRIKVDLKKNRLIFQCHNKAEMKHVLDIFILGNKRYCKQLDESIGIIEKSEKKVEDEKKP